MALPPYYHASKESAQRVADHILATQDRVAAATVQLEPNNGWVVRLVPKLMNIAHLAPVAEIVSPTGQRLSKSPASRKRIKR